MGETRRNPSPARLFTAIREVQDGRLRLVDGHERARARARLLQAVEVAPLGRPNSAAAPSMPWRWVMGGLVAAACAMAVIVNLPDEAQPQSREPLAYTLDGSDAFAPEQAIVAGRYARVLEFEDDTRIELAAFGELRVTDVRSNGATVQLDHGEVTLSVHHEDDTSWQVAAGPWSVHVTGTQFSVAWNPSTEHFRVAVIEGSVRVEGPAGDVAKLRAGESLVRERTEAKVASREPAVEVDSEPASDPDSQPALDLGPAIESPVELHPQSKPNKLDSKPIDWRALAKDSRYDDAWAALESGKAGVLGEAERASADALLDLADVARFTDHRGDAKRVLERLRERFVGSVQAGDAAFELGRIAADGGDDDRAATWFETYLDERPNGSLVNDALVRLMNAYDSLDQLDQARSAATRYLDRQPDGLHASKARKILGR
ncbi:FecR domain-containing protein [Nannocystaceae bacterium ST9]